MSDPWDELKTALRRRFGTAPSEPTDTQLEEVIVDLEPHAGKSRPISPRQWREAVVRRVPSARHHRTYSVDNSDLDRLIREILERWRQQP